MITIKEILQILATMFIGITTLLVMIIFTACSGHTNGFRDLHPESKDTLYTSLKLLGASLIVGLIVLLL